MKYQRALIGVERKLGFLYVPSKGQEFMPEKAGKISVHLEGDKKASSLSYNATHKRIFGLTAWYSKNKIEVGTLLNIELSHELMKVSVASATAQLPNDDEENEDLIDLTGLSSSTKGNIVEDRIKELILLYGQGLLNIYKPVVDNRGIDLIVMRDGVFMPIFLQVKSRFNASKKESLLIEIRSKTFTAHHSFYVIGASFNPTTLELDEKILMVPSIEFEDIATSIKYHDKKRITVSMKDNTKAQGAKYFVKKSELVEKLMEKFSEMERYLK